MANSQLSSNWKRLQEKLKEDRKAEPVLVKAPKPVLKRARKPDSQPESTSKKQKLFKASTKSRNSVFTMDESKSRFRRRSKSTAQETSLVRDHSIPSRPTTSLSHVDQNTKAEENEGVSESAFAGRIIALDCEMVGVGPQPDQDSQIARVSLVNYHGEQIYDSYVKPTLPVTDYRTHVSGIRAHNLEAGRPFREVQADVATFLRGRILVGHYLKSDFAVLMLKHPVKDIRDTSRLQKFRDRNEGRNPRLKDLARDILGLDIQGGEHSSVEDARAAMLLYRTEKDAFEAENKRLWVQPAKIGTNGNPAGTKNRSKRKQKRK